MYSNCLMLLSEVSSAAGLHLSLLSQIFQGSMWHDAICVARSVLCTSTEPCHLPVAPCPLVARSLVALHLPCKKNADAVAQAGTSRSSINAVLYFQSFLVFYLPAGRQDECTINCRSSSSFEMAADAFCSSSTSNSKLPRCLLTYS